MPSPSPHPGPRRRRASRCGRTAYPSSMRVSPAVPARSPGFPALARAAVATLLVTHQVSARIRAHGIRLWRRLPVVPGPPVSSPEGLRVMTAETCIRVDLR